MDKNFKEEEMVPVEQAPAEEPKAPKAAKEEKPPKEEETKAPKPEEKQETSEPKSQAPAEEPKAPKAAKPKEEEKILYIVPHVDGEPDEIFVSVNMKTYQIKTGIEVELPRSVVEILKNSNRQVMIARQNRELMKNVEVSV